MTLIAERLKGVGLGCHRAEGVKMRVAGLKAVKLPPATESKRKQKKEELMRMMAELTETHNRSQARRLLPVL